MTSSRVCELFVFERGTLATSSALMKINRLGSVLSACTVRNQSVSHLNPQMTADHFSGVPRNFVRGGGGG